MDISILPSVNAGLNTLSAMFLITGYVMIRQGRRKAHKRLMLSAVASSTLFLASYLFYHYHHGRTLYPGTGMMRTTYFTILLTHTVLAVAIVPLVLLSLRGAFSGNFKKHKRIARWTLPIWIYVSITGVVIYVMLYRL